MSGIWILLAVWLVANVVLFGLAVHAERKARR